MDDRLYACARRRRNGPRTPVIVQDVTQRKRDEKALNEANRELRQANHDLEQFAYSASHDLQEPLRTVGIYRQLLQRKFEAALGTVGQQYLEFVVQGASRMEQLVRDLLAYTRSSTGLVGSSWVDSEEALDRALANLNGAIEQNQAVILRGTLPRVKMHLVQLEQIFQNLIGNAIKYRSLEPPRICVSAERRTGEWLFLVNDNGIGIDPQYKEQIFGIFKRLHTATEYAGTGIGLAICQRIVERHAGRIWVESELGRGATFFFTIPDEGDASVESVGAEDLRIVG